MKPQTKEPGGQAPLTRRRNAAREADIHDDSVGQSELFGWVFVCLAEQRDAAEGDPYGEAQGEERACMGR